jgi:predicted transcriptional regulator with HTH domain
MPKISKQKKDKISEQILHYLFSISPEAAFTSKISNEIARDEEFVKSLLNELEPKKLVIQIKKNSEGKEYIKRQRWRISNEAFEVYKKHQSIRS